MTSLIKSWSSLDNFITFFFFTGAFTRQNPTVWQEREPKHTYYILAHFLLLGKIDERHRAIVIIGDEESFAARRDVHQTVAGTGEAERGRDQECEDSDPCNAKHARAPERITVHAVHYVAKRSLEQGNESGLFEMTIAGQGLVDLSFGHDDE